MNKDKDNRFKLILKKDSYSLDQILNHHVPVASEVEQQTVEFLKEWYANTPNILQMTSGSTGTPKEITLKKEAMKISAQTTIHELKLNKYSNSFLCISPQYVGGKMMIVRALLNEMHLKVGEVDSTPLQPIDKDYSIDFFSFVPYQLLQTFKKDLNSIALLNRAQAIILGGAAVSEELHFLIKKHLNVPCYSTYGMTETISHVALKLLNTNNQSNYFRAVRGVSFSINHEDCLLVHAPEITGKQTLATNDIVELISETQFNWIGRKDFVINSGGVKIQLEKLEFQLADLFRMNNLDHKFILFGKPDQEWGEKLCLLIESDKPIKYLSKLIQRIDSIYRPKEVHYIHTFEFSGSGKINRKASIQKISE